MKKVAIPLIALLFGLVVASEAFADPITECQGWYNTSAGSATGSSCQAAMATLYTNLLASNHGCPGPYYQPCNHQLYPDPYSGAPVCVSYNGWSYEVTGFFGYGCTICVHSSCMP